ncbi:MAG: hypothetical protein ACJATN_001389 [Neolewinella sp.]
MHDRFGSNTLVHRIFKATKFLTIMTKYIEPRSTDEQLLKFAVIDAVMRSEDLVLLLKLAEDLAVDLPDELKEADDSADGDPPDGPSIMHPDVPSGRTLEEIVKAQEGSGPAVSFTTQPDFGGDYEKELSLAEELEYIRAQG